MVSPSGHWGLGGGGRPAQPVGRSDRAVLAGEEPRRWRGRADGAATSTAMGGRSVKAPFAGPASASVRRRCGGPVLHPRSFAHLLVSPPPPRRPLPLPTSASPVPRAPATSQRVVRLGCGRHHPNCGGNCPAPLPVMVAGARLGGSTAAWCWSAAPSRRAATGGSAALPRLGTASPPAGSIHTAGGELPSRKESHSVIP